MTNIFRIPWRCLEVPGFLNSCLDGWAKASKRQWNFLIDVVKEHLGFSLKCLANWWQVLGKSCGIVGNEDQWLISKVFPQVYCDNVIK